MAHSRSASLIQSPTAGSFLLVFEVELWETQRFMPVVGWGKKRLPTDRPEWADRTGKHATSREAISNKIPNECEWVSEWVPLGMPGLVDKDSWSYAVDFPSADYHATSHLVDVVRRRIWRRTGRVKHKFEETPIDLDPWFSMYLISHTGDDSFDEIDYSDVHQIERKDRITRSRAASVKPRNTNGQCAKCDRKFSFLQSGLMCGDCNKWYCKWCLKSDDSTKSRICDSCVQRNTEQFEQERETEHVQRERERSVRTFRLSLEQAILLLPDGEQSARDSIEAMEFGAFRETLQQEKEDKENIVKNFEDLRQKRLAREMAEARQNKMDEWSSMRGPRQASIKLTVKGATNVPISAKTSIMSLSTSLRASVRVEDDKVFHSHHTDVRHNPQFDFTTYFAISDDTKPILITIEDIQDGVLEHLDIGRPIMIAPLNVRNPHADVERAVSEQLVYTEAGSASLMCLEGQSGETLPPSVTVDVVWTLEAREVECVEFCDFCGQLMSRCDCSPDVLKQHRDEQAQQAAKRQSEIYAARQARIEEDRQARAVELQKFENEQREELLKRTMALSAEEEEQRTDIDASEFQAYEEWSEAREVDRHEVSKRLAHKQETRARLKEHVAALVDERLAVKSAYFNDWMVVYQRNKEERRVQHAHEEHEKAKAERAEQAAQKDLASKKAVKFALEVEQQEAAERMAAAQRAEGAYKKSRQRKAQDAQSTPLGVDDKSKAAVIQQQKKESEKKCCAVM